MACPTAARQRRPTSSGGAELLLRPDFLQKHGFIDAIVSRREMKDRLIYYLDFLTVGKKAA